MTFASAGYTPRELAWQWLNSAARVVFTAPTLVPVVRQMFEGIGVTNEEARKRIWIMDRLWEEPKEMTRIQPGLEGHGRLRDLLGKGKLIEEERFEGKDADETAYICYSSGTTVRVHTQPGHPMLMIVNAGAAEGCGGAIKPF